MKLYPKKAEEKLGFDVLRALIEEATLSRLGQDALNALRPSSDLRQVRTSLQQVGEFQDVLRFGDPVPLETVLDLRPVVRQVLPEGAVLPTEDLAALRLVLDTLRRLRGFFAARAEQYPALWAVVQPIVPLPDLERRIAQIVDDQGVILDTASAELRRIRRQIAQQQQALRAAVMAALRNAVGQGYATEEQPTIRNGRMVIPVRAEAKRKVQGFVHDTSATGQTVYIEPASALDLNNEVRSLELEEQREIQRILRDVADQVRRQAPSIRESLEHLGRIDLLYAEARLANRLAAVVPELNEENVVRIRTGRHPLLVLRFQEENEPEGEASREVVPLNLELGVDFHTLIITGPNAGGKSVAMKTVGLFSLMLAYGLPVPMDVGSSFCLFEQVFVDVGDEQSIEDDLSTFSSHVSTLRYMVAHATPKTLVLIDEAGTGTDPAEGSALAQAALEHLNAVGARTIVTTHHGALKAFAHHVEGVENASMQFDQASLRPTYRFQSGVPGSSYAFEVAARIGLPGELLARARGLVGEQKTAFEDLIASFEGRSRELAERLAEAESNTQALAEERRRYEEADRRLKEETEAIRAQALAEAEQVIRQANSAVERTIREIKEADAEREATRQAREKLDAFKESVAARREKAQHSADRLRAQNTRKPKRQARSEVPGRSTVEVGDQVVLDGGAMTAEVLDIEGREAVISSGSMRARVELDRLTKVGGKRPQQVSVRQASSGVNDLSALRTTRTLDVRGKRVDEALAMVTRFLDEGVAAGLDQVEIIHGKGTGALREAIRASLADSPDVAAFEEAPWDQGGAGVTLVSLL